MFVSHTLDFQSVVKVKPDIFFAKEEVVFKTELQFHEKIKQILILQQRLNQMCFV